MHDPVQPGRVDAELFAGLCDRQARPLSDQGQELLSALARRRVAPAACASGLLGRRARCRPRARGVASGLPCAPSTGLTRRPHRTVGRVDAQPARDLLELAVLGDGGLKLLQTLGNALLGVTKLIED